MLILLGVDRTPAADPDPRRYELARSASAIGPRTHENPEGKDASGTHVDEDVWHYLFTRPVDGSGLALPIDRIVGRISGSEP